MKKLKQQVAEDLEGVQTVTMYYIKYHCSRGVTRNLEERQRWLAQRIFGRLGPTFNQLLLDFIVDMTISFTMTYNT